MQSGGWSVRWQGFEGNDFWTGNNKVSSNASSILDGLKNLQSKNNVNNMLF
jgi:beta-glucosidase